MLQNSRMKKREIFSQIEVPSVAVVRLDGRGFGRTLARLNFNKPYDIIFAKAMVEAVEDFFQQSGFDPTLAYLFSDEISLLFTKDLPYNGRLEKIDSVIPSFISSALVLRLNCPEPLAFDSRVIIMDTSDIVEYFKWRQEECWRNLMVSYSYYFLRQDGMTPQQASKSLFGLRSQDLHELAWNHGTNLAETPAWQRRGILVYRQKYSKTGFNPLTEETTAAQRTKLIQNWEPPIFKTETGDSFIRKIIED